MYRACDEFRQYILTVTKTSTRLYRPHKHCHTSHAGLTAESLQYIREEYEPASIQLSASFQQVFDQLD